MPLPDVLKDSLAAPIVCAPMFIVSGPELVIAQCKAGVVGLMQVMAAELGPRGVRVNAIAPGFIQTDMTKELGDDLIAASLEKIPLKRLGAPQDIARGVAFLASDKSAYVTGAVINVNGGLFMG